MCFGREKLTSVKWFATSQKASDVVVVAMVIAAHAYQAGMGDDPESPYEVRCFLVIQMFYFGRNYSIFKH